MKKSIVRDPSFCERRTTSLLLWITEYCNITSVEVKERIICSLLPYKKNFLEIINGKSDLYGPFWICISLVFLLGAAGNLSGYFSA